MTQQQLSPDAIMIRLRQLILDLEAPGWSIDVRLTYRSEVDGARITFDAGYCDSSHDPS